MEGTGKTRDGGILDRRRVFVLEGSCRDPKPGSLTGVVQLTRCQDQQQGRTAVLRSIGYAVGEGACLGGGNWVREKELAVPRSTKSGSEKLFSLIKTVG